MSLRSDSESTPLFEAFGPPTAGEAPSGKVNPKAEPQRMVDDLISRALAYRTGPEVKALFDFMHRFPHLAPYNAMLLHVQNPGIAYALRAPVWEIKYRRRVKPAARPYVILWTMGPVAFVFDLSDTIPIDPKDDRVPETVANPFPTKGSPPPGAMKALTSACLIVGIEVDFRDFGTNLAGRVQRYRSDGVDFHVALNSKHTEAQQIGTLSHELAHIFCGHMGATASGFWGDRRGMAVDAREFEAETVAYLVTERMNLDIGSVSYLSSYLSSTETLPNYSLDTVLKAVGKLEEMLAGRFRPKKPKKAAPARVPAETPKASAALLQEAADFFDSLE